MNRTVWLVILLLSGPSAAIHADETDDQLARDLVAVVRDPRLPTNQRAEAAKSLTKLGSKASAASEELRFQLLLLRGREQEPLQEAVVEALGAIGPAARSALPTLARASGRTIDLDLALKQTTKQLLDSPATRAVGELLVQLRSRDAGTRLRAAKTLGSLGTEAEAAVPELTITLGDTDDDVRRAAMVAIRRIQPTVPPSTELVQAYALDLRDPDENVRLVAVKTLGKFGTAANPVLPRIQAMLVDPDKDVRRAAVDALAKIAGGP